MAVAHSILVIVYYLLKRPTVAFRELGPLYLEQLDQKHLTNHLVRRLERLGHKVILEKSDVSEPLGTEGTFPVAQRTPRLSATRKAR